MNCDPPHDLEIHRAQKDHGDSLNSVLTKTSPYILALCKTWCRPPLEAADIAQESLLRVAKNINSYRGESAFFSWVYTLTYRTFLDHARKVKRRDGIVHMTSLDENSDVASFSDSATDDLADVSMRISYALESLEPNQRDVLILIDVRELSYESAAQELKVPIGTVRSRLARARLALKKVLIIQGTIAASGDVELPEEQK